MATVTSEWRSKDQVLIDLAKALRFSTDSLEQNRNGRLAPEQWHTQFGSLLRPLSRGLGFCMLPLFLWAGFLAFSGNAFFDALQMVFAKAAHPQGLFEDFGVMRGGAIVAITVGCIGVGLYLISRVSPALYFDLMERKVLAREGRVGAREQQTFRANGKDPIENYFFDFKADKFPVSLEAFRALDAGAAYVLYLLPRSRRLVAMEPKLQTSADGKPA